MYCITTTPYTQTTSGISTVGGNGYLVVEAKLLNTVNFGVPQNRERVFFIGFLKESLKNNVHHLLEFPESPFFPFQHETHEIQFNNSRQSSMLLPEVTLDKVFSG